MKPVKADHSLIANARAALIEKLAPRLELNGRDFADEGFIDRFGVGLHKLSDTAIVNAAIGLLIEHVEKQPAGKSGLDMIDKAPAEPEAD